MDLAEIGLKADSSQITKAETALDEFAKSAGKAETAADKLTKEQKELTTANEQQARASDKLKGSWAGLTSGATFLKGAIAGVVAGLSIDFVTRAADQYTEFSNRLRVAGVEGENFEGVQARLFKAANQNGQAINSVATLYAKASMAGRDLGATQEQLLNFVDGVTAALKVNGGAAEQASGALLQLGQALGAGVVRAEEFNSILEGAPTIAQAVANAMEETGGSVSRLRQLVIDGQITSKEFFDAFLEGSEAMKQTAAGLTMTISSSFVTLSNSVIYFVGQINEATGASSIISAAIVGLANGLVFLADNFGAVAGALQPLLPLFVATFGPYVLGLVLSLATSIGTTLFGAVTSLWALLAANPFTIVVGAIVILLGYMVDWEKSIQNVIKAWGLFVAEWNLFWGNEAGARRGLEIYINADKAVADLKQVGTELKNSLTAGAPQLAQGVTAGSASGAELLKRGVQDGAASGAATLASAQQAAMNRYQQLNGQTVQALGNTLVDGGKYIYNQVTGGIEKATSSIVSGGQTAGNTIEQSIVRGGQSVAGNFVHVFQTVESAFATFASATEVINAYQRKLYSELTLNASERSKNNAERLKLLAEAEATRREAVRGSYSSSSGGSGGANTGSLGGSTGSGVGIGGASGRYASGGSFLVRGNGGTDSQMVAFRATPGERVTVTPQGQAANPEVKVDLKVVNQLNPQDLLAALGTVEGQRVLRNVISVDKEALQNILGVV